MATTIETPPAEELKAVHRHNRWLLAAVLVLVVALIALGAWVIYDQVAEPDTAASDEIVALHQSYTAAWNEADSAAFLALTTEDYTFTGNGQTQSRSSQAAMIGGTGSGRLIEISEISDIVQVSDGADYYTAVANQIVSYAGVEYVGVSSFHIIETDDGLKVAQHYWVGNF